MNKKMLYILLAVFTVVGFIPSICHAKEKKTASKKLPVYVSLFDSYIMQNKAGKLYGPGIEFWEGIMSHVDGDIGYEFKLVTFPEKLDSVREGKGIGTGGITMTSSREEFLDFGVPTNKVGQLIAVRKKLKEVNYPLVVTRRLSTWTNFYFFLGVCLIIRIFALMLWYTEKGNPTIPKKFGLFASIEKSGYYISQLIVWESMTTIGRGKYTPGTRLGYAITKMSWCFGAIILGYMIGVLSTAMFTETQAELDSVIHSVSDLSGRTVTTKKDTFSVGAAKSKGAIVIHKDCKNLEAAFDLLKQGKSDAVVGDSPAVLSYVKNHSSEFVVVGASFDNRFYAPAYPSGWDDVREKINQATLKFYEDEKGYPRVYNKWFGKE